MKYLAILLMGVSFLFGAIDINSADARELMSLKGIGVKKAATIVAYRQTHCFKTVQELQNVKGVGTKFMHKHKDELKVGACKN